ncbi:MAG TPA: hypothetical protein VLQ93_13315, partial [Myxococcaceae bacterium]|nr:hypothetical protein [Myxococcaceae bacterium]
MAAVIKDVVVLLPGLLGSVLEREGKEIWGLSTGAFFRALMSLGGSIHSLTLRGDSGGELADDGVVPTKLIPDTHLLPGFWKIDGYTHVARTLESRLGLVRGQNFFEFPYDWRRDIRFTAKRLAEEAPRWLHAWRNTHGGSPDSRLILVAHSMGGIVSRYFLECLGGWRDTRALITFGTPHRGSLMALQALALGFRKSLGPVKLLDLTEMVRSLPSAYQLLPMYPCVQLPDGRVVRPAEARGLGGLEPERAAEGLAFLREIEHAVESNARESAYLERGYSLHPVVGTVQPTLQGARLTDAGLELLHSLPDGRDLGGDGTVPRVSAMPLEERHHARALYSPTSHAALQNAFEVLAHVEGVLSGQSINLGEFRRPGGAAPRNLSLYLEDAYAHDEPVTVRVRPSEEPVSLQAFVSNVDTRQSFQVALARGPDGLHTGTLRPLPPGVYRLVVKGGPDVVPVADVFAVFPREEQVPEGEDELPVEPTHGRLPGLRTPVSFSQESYPGEEQVPVNSTLRVNPETGGYRDASSPSAPPQVRTSVPSGAVEDEGQTLTRHPSVYPLGPARAGHPLELRVDLLWGREDPETESHGGLTVSGLEPGWRELPIKVHLVCTDMTFRPGGDVGVVLVQRNRESLAVTLTGTVNPNASGELLVLATFEYAGRFCGAARRRIPVESGGAGLPASSTSEESTAPSARAAGEVTEGRDAFSVEADAVAPYLTVQIHRPDRSNPRRLYWMLQVPVACAGLPSRLSGEVEMGTDPAAFFQNLASAARELQPGDHFPFFFGIGQSLYDLSPPAFRETFRALRQQYGPGFPVQFITDDPHIPWELMAPTNVEGAGLLCVEHPVARWLLDYQTSMTARLTKGDLLTIAPDYSFHPNLAPLPEAQEEAEQLVSRF